MFEHLKKYSQLDINDNAEKIGLFIKEGSVSSDIRLLVPFNELATNKKYSIYFIMQKDYNQVKKDLLENVFLLDYVIIQRNALEINFAKLLIKKCRLWNIKIIYEIDDNLVDFDKSNPGYDYYNSIKQDLEYIISNSDIVTVSTSRLKEKLSYLNNNILVIPNRLVANWFIDNKVKKNHDDSMIKIGYMGTPFHSWDLVFIKDAIYSVKEYFLKKDKKVIFELIGGTPDKLDWANQINIPVSCNKYLNFISWFRNVADWDIVVAPLENNKLNYSKSELKYLEYSALGFPGVYSAVGPYKDNIIHEFNGLLVEENDSKEWSENIIRLIEDINLKNKIIINSKKDIEKNYMLSDSIRQWEIIFSCFKRDKQCIFYKNLRYCMVQKNKLSMELNDIEKKLEEYSNLKIKKMDGLTYDL